MSSFAGDAAVEEIAGIELDTRLVGQELHRSARFRVVESGRCLGFLPVGELGQYPAVVVTACEFQCFMWVVDTLSNRGGGGEIEGSACDWALFTGWDQSDVCT